MISGCSWTCNIWRRICMKLFHYVIIASPTILVLMFSYCLVALVVVRRVDPKPSCAAALQQGDQQAAGLVSGNRADSIRITTTASEDVVQHKRNPRASMQSSVALGGTDPTLRCKPSKKAYRKNTCSGNEDIPERKIGHELNRPTVHEQALARH